MSKQEAQRIRNALWQARWQKCQTSGVTMAQYARREGFDAQAAYRWRHLSGLKSRRVDAKFVESSKALRIAKPRLRSVFPGGGERLRSSGYVRIDETRVEARNADCGVMSSAWDVGAKLLPMEEDLRRNGTFRDPQT